MEQKRIRRLPVLDETKRMVGMMSLGDVAHGRIHRRRIHSLIASRMHWLDVRGARRSDRGAASGVMLSFAIFDPDNLDISRY
jgi:CBS-domain-containing membrane protein